MKISNKILILILIIVFCFLILQDAQAAGFKDSFRSFLSGAATQASYPGTQADESFINTKIGQVVGVAVSLIGIIFLALVIFSGIQWMTAGGNEEVVTKARKRVINGTIGVGLTLTAFIIANLFFSYMEGKFLTESGSISTVPVGYLPINCSQNPYACDDQYGPTTNMPMFCVGGICVECTTTANCPNFFTCDPALGLCIASSLECADIESASQCNFQPNCVWEPNPSGTGWSQGTCYDEAGYPTAYAQNCYPPAASPALPYCDPPDWVQCLNGSQCSGIGLGICASGECL